MPRLLRHLALILALLGAFALRAEEAPAGKAQAACPICKMAITKHDKFVDHNGKRIFYGCAGCDKKILANADQIVKDLEAAGVTLVTVKPQTVCPVSNEELDKSVFADHHGARVYFCCKNCRGKFTKEPAKFMEQLNAAGIALDKAEAGQKPAAAPAAPAKKGHEGHNH